jgi:hypothetical protein
MGAYPLSLPSSGWPAGLRMGFKHQQIIHSLPALIVPNKWGYLQRREP